MKSQNTGLQQGKALPCVSFEPFWLLSKTCHYAFCVDTTTLARSLFLSTKLGPLSKILPTQLSWYKATLHRRLCPGSVASAPRHHFLRSLVSPGFIFALSME